ncbi:MAG: phosphate ABC transporter permease PstA [Planctomycetota bacterium]
MSKQRSRLGQYLTWLCGGALAFNLLMVTLLVVLLAVNGLGYFWQRDLVRVTLRDGTRLLGEIHAHDDGQTAAAQHGGGRFQMKVGNRDITGTEFRWVDDRDVVSIDRPEDAIVLERQEWGNFYGSIVEMRRGDEITSRGSDQAWEELRGLHPEKQAELARTRAFEQHEIAAINSAIERLRLQQRRVMLSNVAEAERQRENDAIDRDLAARQARYEQLAAELFKMRAALLLEAVVVQSVDGVRKTVPVASVVRAVMPNQMGLGAKLALYVARLWEFLTGDPRESNTEGGIFPAIFGTVMMVFLMSFAVVPLGVLAALYLREYAKQGWFVRMVRIAVNNLAGVPSIVFGVFGLGFFVYLIGGTIDRIFYPEALPTPTFGTGGILWASLTLALLTVPVVIVATEEGLAAVPRIVREGSLALGATKWETTWRVVVPAAAPGMLTGLILAMARAAGEVAPLMIVGMVKLAPALPLDGTFPFLHFERKFMHLGFHIYDVGFQSPNVEATKPLVFATALLLIAVVTAMNWFAITVRNRLRQKYAASAV